MKRLKFAHDLVEKILNGSKTATWRIFDDKNLQMGDQLEFVDRDTGELFANVEVVVVKEKNLGEITESDFDGHETYTNRDEMLATYRSYYGEKVGYDTPVKMIGFKII